MREVTPGDLILSFEGTFIRPSALPGPNVNLKHQPRPAGHMDKLRQVLPVKYAPIQSDGRWKQEVFHERVDLVETKLDVKSENFVFLHGDDEFQQSITSLHHLAA